MWSCCGVVVQLLSEERACRGQELLTLQESFTGLQQTLGAEQRAGEGERPPLLCDEVLVVH